MDTELARLAYDLGKDVRDWKVKLAQKDLIDSGLDKKRIVPILYRPFDTRFTYYTGKSRGFHCMPRPEVMRHMMHKSLGLCVGRAGQVVGLEKPWNIVFCTDCITDLNLFYRGGNVTFPLYLYPAEDLYNNNQTGTYKHQVNIGPKIFEALQKEYGKKPKPERIFYYVYGVLYSSVYRQRYAEFLKTDFPRVPFAGEYDLFCTMAKLGKQLVDLHLTKSAKLNKPIARFEGKGDNLVEQVKYDAKNSLVFINARQHFGPVADDVWEYQIGGYQVMAKWLKDRKGHRLSLADIKHYCKVATAINNTIKIQAKIDEICADIEKECVVI